MDPHIAAIAPKMGLCALAEPHLQEMERKLDVARLSAPLGSIDDFSLVTARWGIDVPKGDKPSEEQMLRKKVYSFLSYFYWYIERFRALMQLVGNFETVAHVLDSANPRDVLLAFVGAERFAHCLLETASYVHSHGTGSIPQYVRLYLFGGPFGLKEKERFFDLIRRLGVTGEKLDPPWLEDTIELIGRLVANPLGACDVLRHLSAAYVCCVLHDNPSLLALNNGAINIEAIVLAKNIAFQFTKATGIRESLFAAIEAL